MADREAIKNRLITMLKEQQIFDRDPETILENDLVEDGLVDSLSLTQLRALVEEEFSVNIDEKTFIEKLHSINDVIDYLSRQVA
jgi:acyl carrier protein